MQKQKADFSQFINENENICQTKIYEQFVWNCEFCEFCGISIIKHKENIEKVGISWNFKCGKMFKNQQLIRKNHNFMCTEQLTILFLKYTFFRMINWIFCNRYFWAMIFCILFKKNTFVLLSDEIDTFLKIYLIFTKKCQQKIQFFLRFNKFIFLLKEVGIHFHRQSILLELIFLRYQYKNMHHFVLKLKFN